MVNQLRHIAEGWGKSLGLVDVSEDNKELAKKRVAICVECPHAKEMWLKKFIDGVFQRDIVGSGIGCSKCGCPVNEKSLVQDEQCPDNRW